VTDMLSQGTYLPNERQFNHHPSVLLLSFLLRKGERDQNVIEMLQGESAQNQRSDT
jgi:hypothetical protein